MLREYLKSLADKFREVLGYPESEKFNAQDFPFLIEVACNMKYEEGKLALLDESKYMHPTISDSIITINDVSPIEHNLEITLSSDTVTDFSGVKVSRYGKNLLDISNIIGTTVTDNGGTLTCGVDGGITGSGTPTSGCFFSGLPKLYLPSGTYTVSRSGIFTNIACVVYIRDAEGKALSSFGVSDRINAVTNTCNLADYPTYSYLSFEIKRSNNNIEMSGTAYFQLEKGDTATPYELYKEPQTVTANADGSVEGLTNLSPNMTIMTDNDNVSINCRYYRDIDIYIDNLLKSVALIGGE